MRSGVIAWCRWETTPAPAAGGSDERYWSDSLIAHELGHWAMGTFGRAVGESGAHCVGLPTAPGLAWSEGYATWFSADTIGNPIYVDKQHGSMFWFDLSTRMSSGASWLRPTAALGLQQEINENEIAAMLWNLSATQGLGGAPLNQALASARMTVPPFQRGYHREVWTLAQDCSRSGAENTGQSTTSFADYLDALVCSGMPASAVDQATNPSVSFPYTLAPTVDAAEVEEQQRGLVAHLRGAGVGVEYGCYRRSDQERSYVHFGVFPSEAVRAELLAAPAVAKFIAFLAPRCEARPRLTVLAPIATVTAIGV